jgi:hypothetical protein
MTIKTWLAAVAVALTLAVAGARCNRDVELGTVPRFDAACGNVDASAGN